MSKQLLDRIKSFFKKEDLVVKQCSNCKHAMASDTPDLVFCIAHPPHPINTPDGVATYFPMLKLHGKCDEFMPGIPQNIGITK